MLTLCQGEPCVILNAKGGCWWEMKLVSAWLWFLICVCLTSNSDSESMTLPASFCSASCYLGGFDNGPAVSKLGPALLGCDSGYVHPPTPLGMSGPID